MSTRGIALAGSLLLAGCALGPDYERPAMELPAAYPEQDVGAAALQSDWWKLYNDPKLDELVAAALERNAAHVASRSASNDRTGAVSGRRGSSAAGV